MSIMMILILSFKSVTMPNTVQSNITDFGPSDSLIRANIAFYPEQRLTGSDQGTQLGNHSQVRADHQQTDASESQLKTV